MPYRLQMGDDGILRIDFAGGTLERDEVDDFLRDFRAYLDAVTPEVPLRALTIAPQLGTKLLSNTRKAFAEINHDPRLGKAATVSTDRYTHVLVGFILKATRRDNIRFFESEEEALAWLQA
jgi:hypothetical protein